MGCRFSQSILLTAFGWFAHEDDMPASLSYSSDKYPLAIACFYLRGRAMAAFFFVLSWPVLVLQLAGTGSRVPCPTRDVNGGGESALALCILRYPWISMDI